ncbi:MAG: hypothetical protein Q9P44_07500 [Anaerolineae bacterium]|nr:hypothetical protein [Anaerolineae bacterium]
MAKTKDGKKIVYVKEHTRNQGQTTVHKHYRSTPNSPQRRNTKNGLLSWLTRLFRR